MIKRILIEEFDKTVPKIEFDFFDRINILIGDNGTYKTTFLEFLKTLFSSYGIDEIIQYDFKTLELDYTSSSGNVEKYIKIYRNENSEDAYHTAKIIIRTCGEDGIIISDEYDYRYERKYADEISGVFGFVKKYKKYSSLEDTFEIDTNLFKDMIKYDLYPVNYYGQQNQMFNEYHNEVEPVNEVLKRMIRTNESKTKECTLDFSQKIFELILTNKNDSGNQKTVISRNDVNALMESLRKVGMLNSNIEQFIKNLLSDNKDQDANFITTNDLLNRLIMLSREMEEKLSDINNQTEKFKQILESLFYYNSTYSFKLDVEKGLIIQKEQLNGDIKELYHSDLSSGEKQIIGFFSMLISEDDEMSVVAIDEPENSLHIEWQEDFIYNICNANKNYQYIIATHSNHILKNHMDNVIDFNDFFNHGGDGCE